MSYCRVHGRYSDLEDGCPVCRDAEERAEADRAEILSSLSALSSASRDPGDYECPHCRYVSLRRNATRCPLCHGTVDAQFWQPIIAREQRAAQEAKLARERQAQAAREQHERDQAHSEVLAQTRRLRRAYAVFYLYLLPTASTVSAMLLFRGSLFDSDLGWGCNILGVAFLFFTPLVNWYICLVSLFQGGEHQAPFLGVFLAWAVVAAVAIPHFVGGGRSVGRRTT